MIRVLQLHGSYVALLVTTEGERNNEFPGLSLNPEESFFIVGIVTHFVESQHQKLRTYISHFDLLYLLSFVFCQKYSSH